MIRENDFEIALINTEGLWYGLITHESSGFKYETSGYPSRDEAKRVSKILTSFVEFNDNLGD